MTPEALDALNASIAKWEGHAKADAPEYVYLGPDDYPLCLLFYIAGDCLGCPVMERTGEGSCEGSPYLRANWALQKWRWAKDARDSARDVFRAEARAMTDFLRSLLPTGDA